MFLLIYMKSLKHLILVILAFGTIGNQTFANSSKRIDDYNRSLGSLLEETKKTYNEVNYSLRTNAEYINKELK